MGLERRSGRRRSRSPLRSGSPTTGGEFGGGLVVQRAVGAVVVVVVTPVRGRELSGLQVLEQLAVEELVTKLRVEALDVAILPGAAGGDVEDLDPQSSQPQANRLRDKLGTIVTTNAPGNTSRLKEFGQSLITSSLVNLRSTFRARHSRVCSSTKLNHLIAVPLVVLSNTKSHVHTWSLCSAFRTSQAFAETPIARLFRMA